MAKANNSDYIGVGGGGRRGRGWNMGVQCEIYCLYLFFMGKKKNHISNVRVMFLHKELPLTVLISVKFSHETALLVKS